MTDTPVNRKLNVVGCFHGYTGPSKKTGKDFTIYNLEVEDAEGKALEGKYKSFTALEPGLAPYEITKREDDYGISYTLRPLTPVRPSAVSGELSQRVVKLEEGIAALEKQLAELSKLVEVKVPVGAGSSDDEDIPF